jgi:hypothetical protein
MTRIHRSALAMLGLAILAGPAAAQLPFLNDPNVLRCESINSRETTCRIPEGKVAEFLQQNSQAACTAGRTYAIHRDTIVVSQGCRASFRLHDAPLLSGSALTELLRQGIAVELARKVRSDNGFSSTPSVTLLDERQTAVSPSQVRYDGTARISRSGRTWNTVAFESVYDLRTQQFASLDYEVASATGGALTEERRLLLRTRLDTIIEARLEDDYRNSRTSPRFEILTDDARALSSGRTAFNGTGRIRVDGQDWQPVTFESVYDWGTGEFRDVVYRLASGTGQADDTMDSDAQAMLERALADEVRRQKGGGTVQVVVNNRHTVDRGGGRERYAGKFGYSWNDGEWVTRGYTAVLNPSGRNVRELRIFRLQR